MSSIQETVAVLEAFELEDNQPNMEAPSPAIFYDSDVNYNFQDRNAFDTKWSEETIAMARFRDVLEQGKYFINMVYTYRSCSKALPQVKSQDDPNKAEIYEKTFEVLEPEITKLKAFRRFQLETVKLFCDFVRKTTIEKREFLSEACLYLLAKLLDLFALLDAVKNMKACLNNDFAFYKRSFGFLRKNVASEEQTQENHNLYLFLANQNSITTHLKSELQQIAGFDDVVSMIVNQCAQYMEEEKYILPSEKHCLLRVMPYGLFLMDGETTGAKSELNIFKNKKINLSRFAKLFRRYPVVPLYGDMQITLEALIKRSPHFDAKVWGVDEVGQAKAVQEYELVYHIVAAREQYKLFMARFCSMINELRILAKSNVALLTTMTSAVSSTVREGLILISEFSSKVLMQSAWKYAHPNGSIATDQDPATIAEYERVVKHNYSREERFILVEYIAMIKTLAGAMLKDEAVLAPIIRRAVHDELQLFIQGALRDLIRHATKSKRPVRGELMQLRTLAADWLNGIEPNDPALSGQKDARPDDKVNFPNRSVPPSPTQLELIRSLVYSFFAWKSLGLKKSQYSDKDFKDDHIKVLQVFYQRSFYYSYLLNYTNAIVEATDLADLWYREFYLELSKRLQFPIEMSLPFILTDNILELRNAAMTEYLLYPLEIYNDAAARALSSLRVQFLYDEIEAEVNLAFDQLVFKISEAIYAHYKQQASSVLLDKPYKALVEIINSGGKFNVPKSRYEPLLKQRHFQLLGRSIDLNYLIGQRMNQHLRQNIDYAISRFEASDLTSVIELEQQLQNVRFTYHLMRQYFDLDPWDSIFTEANESTSLVSFHGRLVLHVIFELVYDFFPNFNYNSLTQRFVRTSLSFAEDPPRPDLPKAKPNFLYGSKSLNASYAHVFETQRKFFGMPHVYSLLRLVGRTNLALLIGECLHNLELKLHNVLGPYVRELQAGMPPSSKLPLYDYKTSGCYGYFQLKLKDIISYPDLRSEVFQHFKEFGNTVLFVNMLDHGLATVDASVFVQAAPLLGATPDSLTKPDVTDPSPSAPLFSYIQQFCASVATKPGLARAPEMLGELTTSAWRADKFYRPPDQHISIFKAALAKLGDILNAEVRNEWATTAGGDSGVIPIDTTNEFYRFWSAIQFVYCLPTGANELSTQELFGDGLQWAGCTIIYLLRQQYRFETLDFSYHIVNVEEAADTPTASDPKVDYQQFFRKVTIARDLNNSIFAVLNSFVPPPPAPLMTFTPPNNDYAIDYIQDGSQQKKPLPAGAVPIDSDSMRKSFVPSPVPSPHAAGMGTMTRSVAAPPTTPPPPARPPPPATNGADNEDPVLKKLPPGVTKAEAQIILNKFRELDTDGSGTLSLDELVQIVSEVMAGKMGESNVRRLASMQFQVADKDRSGTLSVEEFIVIYAFIKEQGNKTSASASAFVSSSSATGGAPSSSSTGPSSDSLRGKQPTLIIGSAPGTLPARPQPKVPTPDGKPQAPSTLRPQPSPPMVASAGATSTTTTTVAGDTMRSSIAVPQRKGLAPPVRESPTNTVSTGSAQSGGQSIIGKRTLPSTSGAAAPPIPARGSQDPAAANLGVSRASSSGGAAPAPPPRDAAGGALPAPPPRGDLPAPPAAGTLPPPPREQLPPPPSSGSSLKPAVPPRSASPAPPPRAGAPAPPPRGGGASGGDAPPPPPRTSQQY